MEVVKPSAEQRIEEALRNDPDAGLLQLTMLYLGSRKTNKETLPRAKQIVRNILRPRAEMLASDLRANENLDMETRAREIIRDSLGIEAVTEVNNLAKELIDILQHPTPSIQPSLRPLPDAAQMEKAEQVAYEKMHKSKVPPQRFPYRDD